MLIDARNKLVSDLCKMYSSDVKMVDCGLLPEIVGVDNIKSKLKEKAIKKYYKLLEFDATEFILSSEMVVICCNKIIKKPESYVAAKKLVRELVNKPHKYLSCVCYSTKAGYDVKFFETEVVFNSVCNVREDYYDYYAGYNIYDVDSPKIKGSVLNTFGFAIDLLSADLVSYYDFSNFKQLGRVNEVCSVDVTRVTTRALVKYFDKYCFIEVCRNYFSDEVFLESPGGGCYINEQLNSNLEKELKEELGVTVTNIEKIGIVNEYTNLKDINPLINSYNKLTIHCFYKCDVVSKGASDLTDLEKEMFVGSKYYSLEELKLKLNPDCYSNFNIKTSISRDEIVVNV